MTTLIVFHHIAAGLVFVEQLREYGDPSIVLSTPPIMITRDRFVMTIEQWRGCDISGFDVQSSAIMPRWAVTTEDIWSTMLNSPPKTVQKTINYNPIALFMELCGNEGIVKKVVR